MRNRMSAAGAAKAAGTAIKSFFQTRDELSFRNIRVALFPVLLVFPVSVILGNLRYYDHSIALGGFAANELMFFMLGFGWLILGFTPKQFIIHHGIYSLIFIRRAIHG